MAPCGLFHVPRHEPRSTLARRALRGHLEPQLRGPSGPRRPHPPDEPRHGGGGSGNRSADRCSGDDVMEKFEKLSGIAAPLPLINVDTDMIIPKQCLKTIKRSGLGVNLFDEMRYDDDGNEIRFRAQQAAIPRGADPCRGRQFWLWLVARARAVGDQGFRHPLHHRAVLCRYLLQQLLQERHPAGHPAAGTGGRADERGREGGQCPDRGGPRGADRLDLRRRGVLLRGGRVQEALPAGGARRYRPDAGEGGGDRRLRGPGGAGAALGLRRCARGGAAWWPCRRPPLHDVINGNRAEIFRRLDVFLHHSRHEIASSFLLSRSGPLRATRKSGKNWAEMRQPAMRGGIRTTQGRGDVSRPVGTKGKERWSLRHLARWRGHSCWPCWWRRRPCSSRSPSRRRRRLSWCWRCWPRSLP